ncbi:BRCA1-associated protein [Plecturocebus cupreus]
MSVSLVVIRLELAEHSSVPAGFGFSAAGESRGLAAFPVAGSGPRGSPSQSTVLGKARCEGSCLRKKRRGEMSDEEIKKTTLASAVACLEGKSPGEKAAIIHQHLGRREMTDVIIETMKSNPAARGPEEAAEKPVKTKSVSSSNGGESSSRSAEKSSAEEEAADLPTKSTKISKFGFAIGSQLTKKASAISLKLGSSKPKETVPSPAPKPFSGSSF